MRNFRTSSSMQLPKDFGSQKKIELKAKEKGSQIFWPILIQIMVCVIPAMSLVGMGKLFAGGKVFFAFLLVFLMYYMATGKPLKFFALSISALPALAFLRNGLFYNSILGIFGTGLVLWYFTSPQKISRLWKNYSLRWLLFVGILYWGMAFVQTGKYSAALNILELGFSAGIFYILAEQRRYLATAFIGVGISIFTIGLALVGYGSPRLVQAVIEGVTFGNPISFGIPTAFILLYSMVDDGKWLLMNNSPIWRRLIGGTALIFLLLSTSRGSWAVACMGFFIMLLFSKTRVKIKIMSSLLVMGVFLFSFLLTEKGAKVHEFFTNATDEERSLSEKTSGRFDMWILFPKVLQDSPIWGFGPGSGPKVYAAYSVSDPNADFKPGEEVAWHSLYLHIGVETGYVGLILLLIFLASLVKNGLIHQRVTGEVGPLLGIPCFMTIGLSVTALDPLSGLFFGMGLLGNRKWLKVEQSKMKNFHAKTNNNKNLTERTDGISS